MTAADTIHVPGITGADTRCPDGIPLPAGQLLFVVGANGSGKSSLMHHLSKNESNSYWASAHRQLWMTSAASELTPAQYEKTSANQKSWSQDQAYRWSEPNKSGETKTKLTLMALHTAQRLRDRRIVKALESGQTSGVSELLQDNEDPLVTITRIFTRANLPITLSLDEDSEKFMAIREGAEPYPINELSDGERNAFMLVASIITQQEGALFLIDEPERHIHKSIVCPLLGAIFRERPDCRFIVSTHELQLPLEFPESRVLILRDCQFSNSNAVCWGGDLTRASSDISEDLKVNVWGSRRNIVFVEGASNSLDVRLYRLLFPGVTIQPKGDRHQVMNSVRCLAASSDYTWVNAMGLFDGDGQSDTELSESNVYRLRAYAVESIYYHPSVQRYVAERRCMQNGQDLEECFSASIARTMEVYDGQDSWSHLERFHVGSDLENAVNIITKCPIKKSTIPRAVAESLGFGGRPDYENAVRDRLIDDKEFRSKVVALDRGLQSLHDKLTLVQ